MSSKLFLELFSLPPNTLNVYYNWFLISRLCGGGIVPIKSKLVVVHSASTQQSCCQPDQTYMD